MAESKLILCNSARVMVGQSVTIWWQVDGPSRDNPCFGGSGGIVTAVQVCLSDRPNRGNICFGGSVGL